jgi:hypothetical protein
MYQSNQNVLTLVISCRAAPFSTDLSPLGDLHLKAAASIFILDKFQTHVLAFLVEDIMVLCIQHSFFSLA